MRILRNGIKLIKPLGRKTWGRLGVILQQMHQRIQFTFLWISVLLQQLQANLQIYSLNVIIHKDKNV